MFEWAKNHVYWIFSFPYRLKLHIPVKTKYTSCLFISFCYFVFHSWMKISICISFPYKSLLYKSQTINHLNGEEESRTTAKLTSIIRKTPGILQPIPLPVRSHFPYEYDSWKWIFIQPYVHAFSPSYAYNPSLKPRNWTSKLKYGPSCSRLNLGYAATKLFKRLTIEIKLAEQNSWCYRTHCLSLHYYLELCLCID